MGVIETIIVAIFPAVPEEEAFSTSAAIQKEVRKETTRHATSTCSHPGLQARMQPIYIVGILSAW